MQFTGLFTIQPSPEPKIDHKDRGTTIRVRATSRVSWSFKTHNSKGEQLTSSLTSSFLSIWVNNKKDGTRPDSIIERLSTPGTQIYASGDSYSTRTADGKSYQNFDVRNFDFARDEEQASSDSSKKGGAAPTRPPAATPVAAPTVSTTVSDDDMEY